MENDIPNNELDTLKVESVDTDKTPKFDESYIKDLRSEAKKHRLEKEQALSKLAELEKLKLEAENNALIEQGRFKELYEKEQAEKLALINELEDAKGYKQKHLEFINQKRESLLVNLPEDIREQFKDLDVDKLELLVPKFTTDIGKAQGLPNNVTPKANAERNDYKSPFLILR